MTGRDLVSACLRLIGATAPGETPAASEATEGLAALNRMIDSWSTEGLLIYAVTEEAPLTLTAGDATVTLGTGGDITTRPMRIEKAFIRHNSIDYPITKFLTVDEYARIPDKSVQTPYPYELYDDGGYPQRTLKLYPTPSAGHQLILFTLRPLTSIATLDTVLSLPPGYERALVYNGAVELSPEYGRPADPAVVQIAVESKAGLKRANSRAVLLQCDPVPASFGRRSTYDINSGGYRS